MRQLYPKYVLPAIVLIVLIFTSLSTTACGGTADPVEAAPSANQPDESRTPVEVATITTGDIALLLNYSGNLQAQRDVYLVPKVGGEIEQVLVEVGQQVQKGDPIAIIDDDVYATQLKQAQGALSEVKLNLQKMEDGARPEEIAAAKAALDLARAALADVENIDDNERTTAAMNLANAQSAQR